MRIKKETLDIASIVYSVDIEHEGKIFEVSAVYHLDEMGYRFDWTIYEEGCGFNSIDDETQRNIEDFAQDCWDNTDICLGVKTQGLKTIEHD